jgi:hypothetical protein
MGTEVRESIAQTAWVAPETLAAITSSPLRSRWWRSAWMCGEVQKAIIWNQIGDLLSPLLTVTEELTDLGGGSPLLVVTKERMDLSRARSSAAMPRSRHHQSRRGHRRGRGRQLDAWNEPLVVPKPKGMAATVSPPPTPTFIAPIVPTTTSNVGFDVDIDSAQEVFDRMLMR